MFMYKLLTSTAKALHRSKGNAGMDISSDESIIVPARGRACISTGISCAVNENMYVKVCSRSGLSLNHGIEVGAGIVDSSYRGEVKVVLYNHTDKDFTVNRGDRIAQLIVHVIDISEPTLLPELDSTDRGVKGFGSSGI